VEALAGMARAAGVRIAESVTVTGVAAGRVETEEGSIRCDAVVLAPGPWARDLWRLASLPEALEVGGSPHTPFHYWQVREGDYEHAAEVLDPRSPVVHLDADVPVSDHLPAHWGIYFRPGLGRGVAVGGLPLPLDDDCELDPYGPSHPTLGTTTAAFDEAMVDALTWALGRFDGPRSAWTCSSAASQTCFTPDSYPIVGWLRDGIYGVLDSNHGFKMLALGRLAAAELTGGHEPVLDPFRLDRFRAGVLHPASASPYPWT
jgi:glycine/D-amino acid oxidase-like deaminating enzyme